MPLTVGTAGHIDHGKTWLVRALTGKDTDRLPEEQRRGISIDLGYAPLELVDGRRLSLIDVPGHERFVRTMVAGATGIDLFLLVIDAGEGARPQTHEHLAILRLLGIERGVVALTKVDAVDPETIELAEEEARELVPGAAIVRVSARTGEGVDDLLKELGRLADEAEHARADAPTRLPVDRSISIPGFGTVVTGTLWSGSVAAGDRLRLEPSGRDVRVRSVQVHDRDVELAEAGQRVAVSLPGVERGDVGRGEALVVPGEYPTSYRLDVVLDELVPIGGTRACTYITGRRTSRRGLSASAIASPSCGSTVPSSRRAAIASSCARRRRSEAEPSSIRHHRAIGMPRVSSSSHRATSRRRSTRRCGWSAAPRPSDELVGVERAGPWVFSAIWLTEFARIFARVSRTPTRSIPACPSADAPWAADVLPLLPLERARLQALPAGLHADARGPTAEAKRWPRSSARPGCERPRSTTTSSLGSSRRVDGSCASATAMWSERTRSGSRRTSCSSSARARVGSRWPASETLPARAAVTRSSCSSVSMRTV